MYTTRLIARFMAVAAAVALAACGTDSPGQSAQSPAPGPETGAETSTTTPDAGGETGGDAELQSLVAELEGLDAADRESRLAQLAEEGGSITVYAAMNAEILDTVVGAFTDKYDVPVSTYRAGQNDVLLRVLEEHSAGRLGADVVEVGADKLVSLDQEGLLVDFSTPAEQDLVEGATFPTWKADRFLLQTPSWNTNIVSEDQAPRSWLDLPDVKSAGSLLLSTDDFLWYRALTEHLTENEGMTEGEADQYFESLADGALSLRSASARGQLLAAGESAVSAAHYTFVTDALIEQGAPVEWRPPVEPIFVHATGVAPLKGASNPAGALLFTDFLLTDAQEIFSEANAGPTRGDLFEANEHDYQVYDYYGYADDAEEWQDRWVDLLGRLGESAE